MTQQKQLYIRWRTRTRDKWATTHYMKQAHGSTRETVCGYSIDLEGVVQYQITPIVLDGKLCGRCIKQNAD